MYTTAYPNIPVRVDAYAQKAVLDKVSAGILFATIISVITTLLPFGLQILFAIIAFIFEIIAIIGYIFAKKESTIEKLYYIFVASSAVLLGLTFTIVMFGSNGMFIIASTFGITTLIVGFIYQRVLATLPDVMKHANKLFGFGIAFIFLSIGMIFFGYGTFGNLVVSILGAILFSFYLWFDFGRLMRGQYTSPARMAWSIYWDILLIFKYILRILMDLNRNR